MQELLVTPNSRSAIPDQGQLVEVRNRRFVVIDVKSSALPQSMLDRTTIDASHLITLASIADDALGAELQVTWELEAHKRLADNRILPAPTAFDKPLRFNSQRYTLERQRHRRRTHDSSAVSLRDRDRRLSARPRGARRADAARQYTHCRRCGSEQDHHSRPGPAGTDHPPTGPHGTDRLPGSASDTVAKPVKKRKVFRLSPF